MNDDELDRRLAERGARWRAEQRMPPTVDPAVLGGRSLPRWVAPLAAAAAVVTVVAGGAVLLRDDDSHERHGPADTASPSLSEDPLSGAVPWQQIDPRNEDIPPFEYVWEPDPSYAEGSPTCTPDQLTATSRVRAAAGTTYLDVLVSAKPGVRCSLAERPTVRLYDGASALDVPMKVDRVGDGSWTFPVLLDDAHKARISLAWTSVWCVDPLHNDRVELSWSDGSLSVDGFGQSPGCNNPGSAERAPVRVPPWEPETWSVDDGPRVLEPLEAHQVAFAQGEPDEPARFVIELLATERDLSLQHCPNATFVEQHSYDDQSEQRYGLNCAGVPYKDDEGVPYLPEGTPVRFEVRMHLTPGPTASYYWILEGPRPVAKITLSVPGKSPAPGPVNVVPAEDANLLIDVSNQSFEDERVRISVWVDEFLIVDDYFEVGNQHTWETFPVSVEPGDHVVRAEVDLESGSLKQVIRVPEGAKAYGLVEWWHDTDGKPHFTWREQAKPFLYD